MDPPAGRNNPPAIAIDHQGRVVVDGQPDLARVEGQHLVEGDFALLGRAEQQKVLLEH